MLWDVPRRKISIANWDRHSLSQISQQLPLDSCFMFAQLPRQTGRPLDDIFAIFLSIGSPALISSSVFLAVLFRHSIGRKIDKLEAKIDSGPKRSILLRLKKTCEAAKIILRAAVQAPVRLSPREGFLSSLIVLPENDWWWTTAAEQITASFRRINAAFMTGALLLH